MQQGPRIGLLVPQSNTTMEAELAAWLPAGSTFVTQRIERSAGFMSAATLPAELERARRLAAGYAGQSLDLLIYGCTATGFIAGPDLDAELAGTLADVADAPVITTARSVVERLTDLQVHDIAMVTPYAPAVNASVTAFLSANGITVTALRDFGALTIEQLVSLDSEDVAALARAVVTPECQALYIACSQLPTRPIINPLEHELARPVWSSIKATAWNAGRHLGVTLTD